MNQTRFDISTRILRSSSPNYKITIKVENKGTTNLGGIAYSMYCLLLGTPTLHYSKRDIQTWGVRKGDLVSVSMSTGLGTVITNEILVSLPVLNRSMFPYSLSGVQGAFDMQEDADLWGGIESSSISISSKETPLYLSSNQIPTMNSR